MKVKAPELLDVEQWRLEHLLYLDAIRCKFMDGQQVFKARDSTSCMAQNSDAAGLSPP